MISGDGDGQNGATDFTAESAGAALRAACAEVGLDSAGAELLRLGSNAVYRLAASPVVVRIARNPGSLAETERVVGVARWLAEEDFPATRVVSGLRQPLVVGGRVVSFWENAQDRSEYANTTELAELLRRLHWLEEPESLGLPYLDPFARLGERLAGLIVIADADREYLGERADDLHKQYDRLDYVLPFGLVHGDANVGNVIRDHDGRAILIDLDGFALGPREWDLVLTALYYERYGWHTRAEYEAFVFHYGFDVMNWPGYSVLADVRELLMTAWIGQSAGSDATAAEEFARRMHALRTGGSRRDWQPF